MPLSAKEIRTRIEQLLKDRLNKLGSIRTDDAWQICKSEFQYGTVAFHFRCIMMQLKEDGRADFIINGLWFIHKQKK
jgi:hypothetical protein